MSRGQTTLDFGIGVGVFLITVAVLFTVTPSLLNPFTGGGSADPIIVDRAATQLATQNLSSPGHPYVLSESKTNNFFNHSEQWVQKKVLATDYHVNVTLLNANRKCPTGMPSSMHCRLGPTPSNSQSVASARRVVRYDGKRADLRVKIW